MVQCQKLTDLIFTFRQRNFLFPTWTLFPARSKRTPEISTACVFSLASPSQMCRNPCPEFSDSKRLTDIIISTGTKPFHDTFFPPLLLSEIKSGSPHTVWSFCTRWCRLFPASWYPVKSDHSESNPFPLSPLYFLHTLTRCPSFSNAFWIRFRIPSSSSTANIHAILTPLSCHCEMLFLSWCCIQIHQRISPVIVIPTIERTPVLICSFSISPAILNTSLSVFHFT